MTLNNPVGLIGDFIGTIPAMVALAKAHGGLRVIIRPEIAELFGMIPKRHGIVRAEAGEAADLSLDLSAAFAHAAPRGLHMTQAHFHFLGLPVPIDTVPRPELEFPEMKMPALDYLLSPFSRSLPPEQLWPRERWVELVRALPDKRFGLIGADSDEFFIQENNCEPMVGLDFYVLANLMRQTRHSLLSVVTGTSHLAHALGVNNMVFFNQGGPWGRNPDAVTLQKNIRDITVEEVAGLLRMSPAMLFPKHK